MKPLRLCQAAMVTAALILFVGCASNRAPQAVKQLPVPPPAVTVETVTPSPGPEYVWVGGQYEWRKRWVWVPGKWVVPPRPHAIWVGGRWVKHRNGWTWMPSHWEY